MLAVLNAVGALLAIPRLLAWNAFEADTVVVNLIWTIFNLITLGAVLGVAAEIRQVRGVHRVSRRMPALLYTCRGCETRQASLRISPMRGLGLTTATFIRRCRPGEFGQQLRLPMTTPSTCFPEQW